MSLEDIIIGFTISCLIALLIDACLARFGKW